MWLRIGLSPICSTGHSLEDLEKPPLLVPSSLRGLFWVLSYSLFTCYPWGKSCVDTILTFISMQMILSCMSHYSLVKLMFLVFSPASLRNNWTSEEFLQLKSNIVIISPSGPSTSNITNLPLVWVPYLTMFEKRLTKEKVEKVIHAFISSRLDYCNALYSGISMQNIQRLQLIQNAAARFFTRTKRCDHITPILAALHWLPVSFRIDFKILLACF